MPLHAKSGYYDDPTARSDFLSVNNYQDPILRQFDHIKLFCYLCVRFIVLSIPPSGGFSETKLKTQKKILKT